LTFNGLHGVVSQKIELFITMAMRASNANKMYEDGFAIVQAVRCWLSTSEA
jgi:hypothetical protein